jgi:hypothetical protein
VKSPKRTRRREAVTVAVETEVRTGQAGSPRRLSLPEISRFFGIVVFLHLNDHPPPHFHAAYEGREVAVDIRTLSVRSGSLRARAMGLVIEWASLHQAELLRAWDAVRRGERAGRIAPLE